MALPPKFVGLLLSTPGTSAKHTLEIYLDYVCPFSAKIFKTLHTAVLPSVLQSDTPHSGLNVIFRPQIQPWHPSSTLVHEAAAAVLRLQPSKFWDFSALLFQHQTEYFDVNVVHENRNQTYARLAKLAAQVEGLTEKEVYGLLEVSDKPGEGGALNSGNKVTDDVKWMVKYNRGTGVHVTPTAVFNGIVEGSISSSWTQEQWGEWLKKNVV